MRLIFPLLAVLCLPGASALSVLGRSQGVGAVGDCFVDHGAEACASAGGALILTPLLRAGVHTIEELQSMARVSPPIGGVESFSGYFTTDAAAGNQMFWWHFPAQTSPDDAPLLIWLQGGPGGSSLFGAIVENGPFSVDADLQPQRRDATWNARYNMLYIDNPVGAGFSYTTNDGYVENEDEVAANLYSLLTQFYDVFPRLLDNDLFVTGESYGGHYVPALSYKIHLENLALERRRAEARRAEDVGPAVARRLRTGGPNPARATRSPEMMVPLRGLAIGDGWVDPILQMEGYPAQMFNLGLADGKQTETIRGYCDRTIEAIRAGEMQSAFDAWDEMLNGDVWKYPTYFYNVTHASDYDNFMRTEPPQSFSLYSKFLSQPKIRRAMHAGSGTFGGIAHECELHLMKDFMVSMKPRLQTLLDALMPVDERAPGASPWRYRVLVYNGQLDIIIGAPLTETFLPTVQWHGQAAYAAADREVWKVNAADEEVAGYVREVSNLSQVVVRGAGHIAPADQPERVLDMIQRFVDGRPFA
jgi:vitellogenic carboxypeptidase-like protein